jgi:tRNA pseudouridine38-40 synthase
MMASESVCDMADTQNIKAVVRYDGTDFAGWQVQPNARTVQEVIESTLGQLSGQVVKISGAGRTDSRVHALGQVFNCSWPVDFSLDKLQRSLNKLLGSEIRIESVEVVPDNFHASFSATGKRYAYAILQNAHADPFSVRYAWNIGWDVDSGRVEELAQAFVGEHDFAGFCCSGSEAKTTVRTIHGIKVVPGAVVGAVDLEKAWTIEYHGEGFLYKMVRNLTGTLIDVARGHLPESAIQERLTAPASYHGYTAPAKGLFMKEVLYD